MEGVDSYHGISRLRAFDCLITDILKSGEAWLSLSLDPVDAKYDDCVSRSLEWMIPLIRKGSVVWLSSYTVEKRRL